MQNLLRFSEPLTSYTTAMLLTLLYCAALLYLTEGGSVKRAVSTGDGGVTCVVTGNKLFRNGVYMRDLKPEEQTAAQNYHTQLSQWLQAKYARSKLPVEPTTPSFCSISRDQPPTPIAVDCSIMDDSVYITWYNIGQTGDRIWARNLTNDEKAERQGASSASKKTPPSPLKSALSYPCIVMHAYSASEQSAL